MAIYFAPYPATTPSTKLTQYQVGDFYVTSAGAPFQLTKGAITTSWTKYTAASPLVAGSGGSESIPAITASTLVPATQVSTGQVVNFIPVSATGGAVVATSYTTTGTLVGLSTTISPALPSGLAMSSAPSVQTVVGSDGISRYYNAVTVTISGTPTVSSPNTTYVVSFTDASGLISNASFGLTVASAGSVPVTTTLAVASQTLTQYTTATTFTPVTATGGTGALKYTISPNLPTGLSLSTATGAISGNPTAIISQTTFAVTVTDTVGQNSKQSFSLTVNPVIVSTVLVVPSFNAIQSIAITPFTPVTASGGIGTLNYVISPSLPVGLSFSATTGAISGTPSSSSPSTSYTVTVTDSNPTTPQSSSKSFTLVVAALPLLTTTLVSPTNSLTRNSSVNFTPVAASGGYGSLTYAVSPGLPASLVFNTSTGVISGTPTIVSTSTSYTVTVNDQATQTSSKTFSLSVSSVPLSVTTVIPTATLTRLVTFSPFTPVTASGGYGSFTWAVSPGLPSGITFNTSNGQVGGVTSAANPATTYTVSVTDQTPQTSTSSFRLTVNNPNAVTATTVVSVTTLSQNTAFTPFAPVTAIGGYGTLSYSINPTLPSGLLYGSGTGQISGTPTAYFNLTSYSVTVSDSLSQSSTASFSLQVATPKLVTTLAVPSISEYKGIAITEFAPVTVVGGTGVYTFSIAPSLPAGLSFLTSTGQIYGTATTSTSATNYAITVTDTLSNTSSQVFNLTVLTPTPVSTYNVVTATSLVKLVTNASFNPVGAYGGYGSLSFFVSPTLPTGLSFNSANGRITGTPSVVSSTATYTVIVSDSISQTSSTQFTLAVTNPLLTLTAVSSNVYNFLEYYAVTPFTPVTAIGGSGIYTYSINPAIDSGLTFNTTTSVISGTPTASINTTTYTITVADGTGVTSSTSIRVYIPAPTPLTRITNATAIVTTITQAITSITPVGSTGGVAPINYSISPSLPSGLSFNASSGQLTGTPTALSNNTSYTVTVTDSISETTSGSFTLMVKPVQLTYKINYPSIVEVQYSAITPFTPVQGQGGYGTLSYTISPSFSQYFGLTFNNGTGQITGTPAQVLSTTTYTVTIADQDGQSTSASFNLIVNPDPPPALQAVLQVPAASFNVNVSNSITPVVGAGGVPGYTYALYPSTLPTGLSFNNSTGAISGSATVPAATATYVVTVTDQVPQSQSQSFSLSSTPLVITNPNTTNNLNVVGGGTSSSPCTGAVVIHGGTGITGCLNIGGNVSSTGTVSANTVTSTNLNTTNISSSGTVSANTLTSTNVNTGNVNSTGTVTAGTVTAGNVTSTGTVSAGTVTAGNVTSTGTVSAGTIVATTITQNGSVVSTSTTIEVNGTAIGNATTLNFGTGTTATVVGGVANIFAVSSIPTLQSVTDGGSTTTDAITVSNLITANSVNVIDNVNIGGTLVVSGGSVVITITSYNGVSFQSKEVTGFVGGEGLIPQVSGLGLSSGTTYYVVGVLSPTRFVLSTSPNGVGIGTIGTANIPSTGGYAPGLRVENAATFNSTATSTSTTTGAVIITGGVGIGGCINIGGTANIDNSSITNNFQVGGAFAVLGNSTLISIISYNGVSFQSKSVTGFIGGETVIPQTSGLGLTAYSTYYVIAVLGSTKFMLSTSQNGSGVGTVGTANILSTVQNAVALKVANGSAYISTTTNSFSTTTGALVVAGGVGIGGNLNVGGSITAASIVAGGVRTTSSATAPTSPTPIVGDIWYNTSNDAVYRYTSDGTTSYWIDITGPVVRTVVGP